MSDRWHWEDHVIEVAADKSHLSFGHFCVCSGSTMATNKILLIIFIYQNGREHMKREKVQ